MSHLAAAVLSALTALVPPARHAAHELPARTAARYAEAASQIAEAAEERPVGRGPRGARFSAALILGALVHESGFDARVDAGHCPRGLCPGGAVCVMQIEMSQHQRTPEGWSRADIQQDRTKCIRHGLRLLASSWWTCGRGGEGRRRPERRLAAYASGKCDRGLAASAEIWRVASRALGLLDAQAPPKAPVLVLLREPRLPRGVVAFIGL